MIKCSKGQPCDKQSEYMANNQNLPRIKVITRDNVVCFFCKEKLKGAK